MGSAFAGYTFSKPWQLNSSGSATSSAPAATAERIRRSAVLRFSAFYGVEDICTAAALISCPLISPPPL